MDTLPDMIRNALQKLAEFLGLRKSERAQIEAQRRGLLSLRRNLTDELDNLKTDIRVLEQRALKLAKELEQAKGAGKSITADQIELTREEIRAQQGRQDVLVSRISNVNTALGKLDELEAARKKGVGQDVLDDIAISLDEALAELKGEDKAARDLKHVEYRRERPQSVQQAQEAEVDTEAIAAPAQKAPKEALSQETAEWLKQLESEQE